ncbi:hypothetical protein ACR777_07290 [Sphingobacterium spiritivorum]|uniref:hypothetical protein n=1 Tax=Sphingobacterium spiritivorum TaxID=258 RepID=UPI003DA487E0
MAKDNKKELIDDIAGKLRDYELPYREGAWEKFASLDKGRKSRVLWPYWSAAAVLLALGISYITYNTGDLQGDNTGVNTIAKKEKTTQPAVSGTGQDSPSAPVESSDSNVNTVHPNITNSSPKGLENRLASLSDPQQHATTYIAADQSARVSVPFNELRTAMLTTSQIGGHLSELQSKNGVEMTIICVTADATPKVKEESKFSLSVLGTDNQQQTLANQQINRPKAMGRKWELGAFVSPASASSEVSMGGGLSVAYNLSKKLSVRSGVSLQNYQMAMALNPGKPSSASPAYMDSPVSNNAYLIDMSSAQSRLNPNFTAVSGSVLTLDIPVEMKYAITRNLYTTAGVSMVSVLQQERLNHYVENINGNTFAGKNANGVGAAESNNIQAVNKTVKSNDQNVETNGFNGFINLSIGRKLPIKKTFSISVEPFYRLPLGQFKNSDVNYSNGGIKVITNF